MTVRPVMAAAPAEKAFRPTRFDEIGPALRVGPEPLQEARQVAGQVGKQRFGHGVLRQCSTLLRYAVTQPASSDRPSFLDRFGTDAQCRANLVQARSPEGIRRRGGGHDRAYSHQKRLIEACWACGKQHSILARTIFERTKTGLARWILAIYLVTASKGGISA